MIECEQRAGSTLDDNQVGQVAEVPLVPASYTAWSFMDQHAWGVADGAHSALAVLERAVNARDENPWVAGFSIGCALRWAFRLVDAGADPKHVRAMLELGLRVGAVP